MRLCITAGAAGVSLVGKPRASSGLAMRGPGNGVKRLSNGGPLLSRRYPVVQIRRARVSLDFFAAKRLSSPGWIIFPRVSARAGPHREAPT
jgi:hypothetical protein